ncbi:hypothetical protein DL96DRAFT_371005 [Flagelloscypha sp. PMI_526]|nr:hypothetical protein DL96DRAFT_371005 [Flagelloscypha sp. PMI_526]
MVLCLLISVLILDASLLTSGAPFEITVPKPEVEPGNTFHGDPDDSESSSASKLPWVLILLGVFAGLVLFFVLIHCLTRGTRGFKPSSPTDEKSNKPQVPQAEPTPAKKASSTSTPNHIGPSFP